MTSTESNIKKRSPFLSGIARCFDIAGLFSDITIPDSNESNQILNDWQAVGLDYHNSIKIVNEELNEAEKTKGI
jgi:hypothetical protein